MICRERETLGFIENANKKSHERTFINKGDREEKSRYCFCLSSFKRHSYPEANTSVLKSTTNYYYYFFFTKVIST